MALFSDHEFKSLRLARESLRRARPARWAVDLELADEILVTLEERHRRAMDIAREHLDYIEEGLRKRAAEASDEPQANPYAPTAREQANVRLAALNFVRNLPQYLADADAETIYRERDLLQSAEWIGREYMAGSVRAEETAEGRGRREDAVRHNLEIVVESHAYHLYDCLARKCLELMRYQRKIAAKPGSRALRLRIDNILSEHPLVALLIVADNT